MSEAVLYRSSSAGASAEPEVLILPEVEGTDETGVYIPSEPPETVGEVLEGAQAVEVLVPPDTADLPVVTTEALAGSTERRFENGSSTPLLIWATPLPDFPQEIKEALGSLRDPSGDEDALYDIADTIAAWLPDGSVEHQTALAVHLRYLLPESARILLSAFADAEVALKSISLLNTVVGFVNAQDKRLAQAAATCLLVCGGTLGKTLLDERLQSPSTIPHARLIQGIIQGIINLLD